MDLFVINRYWGENDKGESKIVDPKHRMKKLLQRIEERKSTKIQKRRKSVVNEEFDVETCREVGDSSLASTEKNAKKKKMKETTCRDSLSALSDSSVEGVADADKDECSDALLYQEMACVGKHKQSMPCMDFQEQHQSLLENECYVDETANKVISESLLEEKSANSAPDIPTSIDNFTIIGAQSFKNRVKASHKLPPWLENPVAISVDLENFKDPLSNYEHILDSRIIQKLKENGITHFFPVQAKVIPWLVESNLRCRYHWPRDLCVSAPTGSGKTLAFVLPIVQALMDRIVPEIRVLVVLPVVELAKQVGNVFRQYCAGTGLQVTIAVGGGTSFVTEHSLLVNNGELVGCQTDIFVTTPGRLVAHLRADSKSSLENIPSKLGKISFSHLQFLVIDEADRVAEGGQNDWLSHLVHHLEHSGRLVAGSLPPSVSTFQKSLEYPCRPPQKLLFSATLSNDPEKLSAMSLFQPKLFLSVSTKQEHEGANETLQHSHRSYTTPKELSEEYVVAENGEAAKPLVLLWILQEHLQSVHSDSPKVLIFVGTRKSSRRLALLLSLMSWEINTFTVTSCHLSADLSGQDREKILQDFVKGRTNILVCSDALARGVDIPLVDLVVSYDPPRFAKNHIHRIGRTGRAGHPGCAISILTPTQVSPFAHMITGGSTMGDRKKIEISLESLSALNEKYEAALTSMEKTLQEEHQHFTKVKKRRKGKFGDRKAKEKNK